MNRRQKLTLVVLVAIQLLLFSLFLLYESLPDVGLIPDRLLHSMHRCITSAHRDLRYVKPEVCITRDERLRALEDLVYVLKVMLENAHVVYWIDSGTLLGVYRARQLVPWDYNADIGITMAGLDYIRSTPEARLQVPEGYQLTVYNSSLYDAGETSLAVPVKLVDTRFGFYANIYAFHEFEGLFKDDIRPASAPVEDEVATVGDGVMVEKLMGPEPSTLWHQCIHCLVVGDDENADSSNKFETTVVKHLRIPSDWVFPLRPCKVEMFEVMCPAQMAPYLMYIFGNRFLTPELWE